MCGGCLLNGFLGTRVPDAERSDAKSSDSRPGPVTQTEACKFHVGSSSFWHQTRPLTRTRKSSRNKRKQCLGPQPPALTATFRQIRLHKAALQPAASGIVSDNPSIGKNLPLSLAEACSGLINFQPFSQFLFSREASA